MMDAPVVITPKAAKAELAKRELSRRELVRFVEYVSPWWSAADMHRLICRYLELVETYVRTEGRTGIGRLMINMPPRYGKTELVSRHFPSWFLGRNPDKLVAMCSYGADLAELNSREVRNIVEGAGFAAVFGELSVMDTPVEVSDDTRSVKGWQLASPHRGGMAATGVGGPLTGKGAHLLIIDDPIKNREDAESAANRQKIYEWYTSTAYTRLEKGAAIIIVQTRWHGEDLSGRLLQAMASGNDDVDQWVVLSLQARCEPPVLQDGQSWDEYHIEQLRQGIWDEREDPLQRRPGQALWPEKYSEADLAKQLANSGPYDFAALYQQRPYLRSGSMFQREWFTIVDAPPDPSNVLMRIRYWDKAGNKTGSGGDYTVGVLMSITKDDVVYVEHVSRGQYTPMRREEVILSTAKLDRERKGPPVRIWHQQDPATAGLESAQATNRNLAKNGFAAHFKTVSGDKALRAGPWSGACEGGMVRLVRGAWNEAFIEEHVAFPLAPHDDQVDVSSSAYTQLTVGRTARKAASSYQG